MATREIYPNAPLRYVAVEIRYGFVPDLSGPDGRARVYEELGDRFPLAQTSQSLEITLPGGPQPKEQLQMLNRERTRSVSVGADLLAVNTSAFVDFEEFLETLRSALSALRHSRIASVDRIGIRYIDEIRVPGVNLPDQWDGWIDQSLLGPISFGQPWNVELAESAVKTSIKGDRHLMLRVGPRDLPAVDPNGPLKLVPQDGHYFLLDLDSFWQPNDQEVHDFDVEEILRTCVLLDEVAHEVFERAVTDRLRDEIMRKES